MPSTLSLPIATFQFTLLIADLAGALILAFTFLIAPSELTGCLLPLTDGSGTEKLPPDSNLHALTQLVGVCIIFACLPIAFSLAMHRLPISLVAGCFYVCAFLMAITFLMMRTPGDPLCGVASRYEVLGVACAAMLIHALAAMSGCLLTFQTNAPWFTAQRHTLRAPSRRTAPERVPLLQAGVGADRRPLPSTPPDSSATRPSAATPQTDSGPTPQTAHGEGAPSTAAGVATSARPLGPAAALAVAAVAEEEKAAAAARAARGYGMYQLIKLVRSHRGLIFFSCFVLLVRLPFSLAVPNFIATTIDALHTRDFVAATRSIVAIMLVGSADALLDFWCVYLFGRAQQRVIYDLRCDLFDSILLQDVAFFDKHKTGEITSRLTADCAEMANDLTWVFRWTLEAFVRVFGIMGYMLIKSWRLALLVVAVVPITAWANRHYGRFMHSNQAKVQTALAAANELAQEVISSVRTVFLFGQEEAESSLFRKRVRRLFDLTMRQVTIQAVYYMALSTFLINTCVQAAILAFGSWLVYVGDSTPATLLAFMLYQGQLQEYTANIFSAFTNLLKSSGAAAKVFEYMDRQPAAGRPVLVGETNLARMRHTRGGGGAHPRGVAPRGRTDDLQAGQRGGVASAQLTSASAAGDLLANPTDSVADVGEQAGAATGPTSPAFSSPSHPPLRLGGDVCVEGVRFAYPSRPEVETLRGVSFSAREGQVVALVGASGAGKSTLFHLLSGLYEPQVGSVTIDSRHVARLDHKVLRSTVAVVGQEPVLLSGSVRMNILYGLLSRDDPYHTTAAAAAAAVRSIRHSGHDAEHASSQHPPTGGSGGPTSSSLPVDTLSGGADNVTDTTTLPFHPAPPLTSPHGSATWTAGELERRMIAAAKAANAHDFITSLPDGYDTECGERGTRLSGGQKQRIAIARCLAVDPSVLLLDEATSALDTESERLVQQALDVAMRGRTTIVIAHRLSTIQGADKIVVMSRGKVVEEGTHEELVRRPMEVGKASYAALVQQQMFSTVEGVVSPITPS